MDLDACSNGCVDPENHGEKMVTETVLLTFRYDANSQINPKEWNWLDILDIHPDDLIDVR